MKIRLTIISLFTSYLTIGGISIKGEISNMGKDQPIYLYEYFVNQITIKDYVMVKDGKFSFKYKTLPLGKYKIGFDTKISKDIILGSENITIKADYREYNKTFSIINSKENELYNSFSILETTFKKETEKINLRARQIKATAPDRNIQVAKLQAEFDSLSKVRTDQLKNISTSNTNSYSGVNADYLLSLNTLTEENFYTNSSNPILQKGDAFLKSFNTYLSRFLVGKTQNELKAKLISLPETQPEKSQEKEAIYLALIAWSKNIDANFSGSIAKNYVKEYKESTYAKQILKTLPKLPPTIGDIAPDFTLKNPEGIEVPLSSTKGKVVLLDFWASWCGPCRRENPNVVKTYNQYKDKGFTVFSVSLDKTASKWKAAILKDALAWENHVSDLKGWSSSAGKLYGVKSIPATFLIDQNGVIISKNLRGVQLENKLKELFGE